MTCICNHQKDLACLSNRHEKVFSDAFKASVRHYIANLANEQVREQLMIRCAMYWHKYIFNYLFYPHFFFFKKEYRHSSNTSFVVQAWILQASVRENILFGKPYDEDRYVWGPSLATFALPFGVLVPMHGVDYLQTFAL